MKWWAINTNLPVDVIVRLPHPRTGNREGQETFLATSAETPTRNYDIECSNHHPSITNLRPKWLSHSKMKWWAIHTNLPVDFIVRLTHPWSGDSENHETFLPTSAEKLTRNYVIECSNHHPSLSTPSPKGLRRSKMKWWARYASLPVDVIVRLPHPRNRDSQCQETFLPHSAGKQSRNYDIECSNHHPLLSNLRLKGLSRSKIKWWAIHTNSPLDVIVRLPRPRSGDSQDQETFLARSSDKQIRNYDIECSNHHLPLSTGRPKGTSSSKMNWWAIHTNSTVHVIVRLPHPWSVDGQNHERFLAPSADKKSRNCDIQCSNHHPSLSNLRSEGLSRSKMKWWAVHTNLRVDVRTRLPHPRSGDRQYQETFLAPSA